MKRILLAAALALFPSLAEAQTEIQALVDRSTLSLQEMMTQENSQTPRTMLQRAVAVMICPRIFKAGFLFAGSGGNCVLLGRAGNGTWSYPAFYTIGSASFGLQIGVQDSSLTMLVLTQKGLNAVLNTSFKFGAGASIAIATVGAGVEGALTTAIGADILAFSETRGAFAGISLEGSVLDSRSGWDETYYGRPVDARNIVVSMQGANPGAEPLRELLTRYGTAGGAPAPYRPPGVAGTAPPAYASAAPPPPPFNPPQSAPVQLQPSAPVQQEQLPPPR
jgi:lipid-binding SYLF domain-containing protein